MSEIALAAADRLIRKAGAKRVSEEACEALIEVLEEKALGIAKKANEFAQHANRKTVVGSDVKLAVKNL